MSLVINIVLSGVGFALLLKCADFFVDAAASFARNFKIPTTVIGLTIIAFGTSAPELAISFSSHISGNTEMLFGNVIGSSISNILIILGIAVLVFPFNVKSDVVKKEVPIMTLITLGLSVLFLDTFFDASDTNALSRADGIILILFFSIFVFYLITVLSNKKNIDEGDLKPKYRVPVSIVVIISGLAGIVIGSELLVSNMAAIAVNIGISQKIITVTIISIGTSLPELVTTITAARKGENSMAIGSIVGSNIFNTCIVLGIPIVILGEAATLAFNIVDIVFMLLAAIFLWIFAATDRKLKRFEALILIAMYCAYATYIFMQ